MSIEKQRSSSSKVIEENKGKIRNAGDLFSLFPGEINPHYKGFLKQYFRLQLRIANKQKVRAEEISDGLSKRTGFKEFENNNQSLLAAIDIVVRGSTNRKTAKPSFEIVDD